ncbi:hypothetical protein, partial [uncultured Duncaniella sp.]|uniref:hypothetical protein n=1 Tax=uncultured Duncaniella sp. TaxID=2768039 RepID=UPI0025B63C2E
GFNHCARHVGCHCSVTFNKEKSEMVRSVRLCPRYSAMRPAFSFRRSFLLSAQRKYNPDTDYPNFQGIATAFDCRRTENG